MNQSQQNQPSVNSGIRLNRLNLIFIAVGLVIALAMVFSMYQTTNSFREIVSVTESYLSSQQTAGMLKSISRSMSEQCAAFLQTGSPENAHTYAGQLTAFNTQLEADTGNQEYSVSEDKFMQTALETFRTMTSVELRAMRLMADTLPMGLQAFPEVLQETELSAEDQALSPEEKKALALSLVSTEEYKSYPETIDSAVDDTHRFASEKGRSRAEQTDKNVSYIILRQKILIFLFVAVAVLADGSRTPVSPAGNTSRTGRRPW